MANVDDALDFPVACADDAFSLHRVWHHDWRLHHVHQLLHVHGQLSAHQPPNRVRPAQPLQLLRMTCERGGLARITFFFLTNHVKIIILSVSLKYCYFVSCKVKECGGGVGLEGGWEGGQVIECWVVIQSYYGRKSSRICKINDALWICTISFVFGVCVCWKRRYWMPLLILYVIVFCVWFHFVSWTILLSDWLTGTMP